jgi:hypothetical protein
MYLTIPTLNGRWDVVALGSSLVCISVSHLDATPAQFASRADEVDGDDGIRHSELMAILDAQERQLSPSPPGIDPDCLKRAIRLLLFCSTSAAQEASVGHVIGAKAMDAQADELTIRGYVRQIRSHLETALGIARAADACAGAGFHDKAVEITLDLELPLCEATTLVNATSRINRIEPN